ncbi:type 1 glutamine amidotransferase [Gordonia westfalica]|uniref:Type 1 glutamine amidotransferase n=1 Tax=Gordonia westfalica TaxID=158898 RepID=A0ABU2GMI3_9ACTN|nr:type 1 glutamine amidotransferase [Gordonia westfalica]MDS1112302.1 type 1 glutamine amidotransferase [Gordonia westfalica]
MTDDRPRVLEIRHADSEPPGSYGPPLHDLADVTTLRIWREPAPTDLSGFDAIVTLGGAMGVGDAQRISWIADEIDLLRRALGLGIPIWGVCLGAQMLAAALGGDVYTSTDPEVGIHSVTLNDAAATDPVWGFAAGTALEPAAGTVPTEFDVVQWHFDTFTLPPGATLLASSAMCVNQLYRHGNCYGVQFHLEAGGQLVGEWLDSPGSRSLITETIGAEATDRFAADAADTESVTVPLARTVLTRWLSGLTRG